MRSKPKEEQFDVKAFDNWIKETMQEIGKPFLKEDGKFHVPFDKPEHYQTFFEQLCHRCCFNAKDKDIKRIFNELRAVE